MVDLMSDGAPLPGLAMESCRRICKHATERQRQSCLTMLAKEAGLDGVVCSGNEVAAAKKFWPSGFFVVPGVRPSEGVMGYQMRVLTQMQAFTLSLSNLSTIRQL